jgi:hypothetical protein
MGDGFWCLGVGMNNEKEVLFLLLGVR